MLHALREWLVEPENAIRVHLWCAVLWLIPGSIVTLVWLSSVVAWVSWLSLYAIVLAHMSSLQAALADRRIKDNQ